jgi:hypothetical protein
MLMKTRYDMRPNRAYLLLRQEPADNSANAPDDQGACYRDRCPYSPIGVLQSRSGRKNKQRP